MFTFLRRARRKALPAPSRPPLPRMVTVPAHAFIVGATGIVKGSTIRSQIGHWIKKLLSACFVAAMIATGVLLFTHFTQKWTQSGYPAIPISAMGLDPPQQGTQQAVPLGGDRQRQRTYTQARPTSNFAQYEG